MSALYGWLRRHPRLVDGVLAAVLAFGGLATAVVLHRWPYVLETLGLTIPVIFRRAHPVGAFWTAMVIGAIQVLTWSRPVPPDLALLVLLYTLAAYTTRRQSVIGLAACLLGAAAELGELYPRLVNFGVADWLGTGGVLLAGPTLLAWVLGDSMRYRRAYYVNLEERAARLERDRDVQAQMAAAAERARIARELHDVVAHNVSVMIVQADGAAYALDSDPERTRQALTAIATTGRQALAEMRVMLGVLRKSDEKAPPGAGLAPPDSLSSSPASVSSVSSASSASAYRSAAPASSASSEASASAYRSGAPAGRAVPTSHGRAAPTSQDGIAGRIVTDDPDAAPSHAAAPSGALAGSAPAATRSSAIPDATPAATALASPAAPVVGEAAPVVDEPAGSATRTPPAPALAHVPPLAQAPGHALTGHSPELAPMPDIGQLDDLLDQARAVGLPVSCTIEGPTRPLPGGIGLTAYRIIQESLTNTRKHAGRGARADVRLRYLADAIEVTVTDTGIGVAAPCDGAGHGLTGMRERVALYGGTLAVGPNPGGGFGVLATLPTTLAQAGAA